MAKKTTTATTLIEVLWPEVFQTEESARVHPLREVERLGATPPAAAMRAVSQHASRSLTELRQMATRRGHKASSLGRLVGQAFSVARSFGSDLVMSREKSYRATLLGIHHGIGAFVLLENAATASGDEELAGFCHAWLAERRALSRTTEEALAWFAEHPRIATSRASSNVTLDRATP